MWDPGDILYVHKCRCVYVHVCMCVHVYVYVCREVPDLGSEV